MKGKVAIVTGAGRMRSIGRSEDAAAGSQDAEIAAAASAALRIAPSM